MDTTSSTYGWQNAREPSACGNAAAALLLDQMSESF